MFQGSGYVIPDMTGVWSALDAHERVAITFREMIDFLEAAGEFAAPLSLSLALGTMVKEGTVWTVFSPEGPPRYVLRGRLQFRRACREQA